MELKKIKILINSNGTYLDTILPPITANEDGRTIVQVIAPFPITDIVGVNYSIRPIQATVKGSYLVPTGKFGKDVLADDYTHFQTVADWNVFEIPINAVALEYISKYRAGLVLVSFAITQLQTPYFATNYLGLFSNTQPIPATTYNDGDYFIANEYNFTAHDITWAKGDYAYFYNGKWNKGKSVLKASTPSIELPVDPSLKDAPQLEYDEDVALLLANDLGLLTQRVSQSETDIESAENDINEIDGRVGVNETDIYNLESDVDDLETEIGNIKNGTTIVKKAEQDQLGNVINTTYETKIDATSKKAEIDGRLDTAESDIDNLQFDVLENTGDIADLQTNKVPKTTKVIGLDLQDNILLTEFKTALGNATQSVAGLLSAEDKTHLDGLVALLESSDGNTVVDTIGEILAIFQNYPEGADLVTALNGKVDKEAGKGLSQNDFTDALKNKLDGIEAGAQINPYSKSQLDSKFDNKIDISKQVAKTPDMTFPVGIDEIGQLWYKDDDKDFTNEIREVNYKVKNIEAEIRDKFDANTTITDSGCDLTIRPNGEGNVSVLSMKGISDLNKIELPNEFEKISDLEYRYTNGAFNVSYDVLTGVFTVNGKPASSTRISANLPYNEVMRLQAYSIGGNTIPPMTQDGLSNSWAVYAGDAKWINDELPNGANTLNFKYFENYKTSTSLTNKWGIYFSNATTFDNYKFKLMLSLGSETPDFSPINISGYEVTGNKRVKVGKSELYFKSNQIINDNIYIRYEKGNYVIGNEIINTSGFLTAIPNENVLISNHTFETVEYNNGAILKYRIKNIEKILILNNDKSETIIDVDGSIINNNTFTNSDINNGELIYVVYEIDTLEYDPLIEISYFNGGGYANQDDLNQVEEKVAILENKQKEKVDIKDLRGLNIFSGVTIPTNTSGVTITYNEELNRLTINGTVTSDDEILLNSSNVEGNIFRRLKYVSGTASELSGYWGSTASGFIHLTEYSSTYYTQNYDYHMLRIRLYTGTVYNNYTFEPQISYAEEGEDIPYSLPNKVPKYLIVGEVTGKSEEELIELKPYEKNELDLVIDKDNENANSNTLDLVILADTQNDDLPNERVVRSFAQIQHFLNNNKMDFVAHLGDIIYGSNKVDGIERLKFWTKQMKNLNTKKIITLGNHDDGSYGQINNKITDIITHHDLYNEVVRPIVDDVTFNNKQENGLYYYKDLEDKKIRIIVLDSIDYPIYTDSEGDLKYVARYYWGFGEKQIQWLAHEALNLKKSKLDYKDWAVMIMTHIPNRSDVSYYAQNDYSINNAIVTDILNAFKLGQAFNGTSTQSIPEEPTHVDVDFTSQGNMELIGYFNGHGHIDIMGRPDGVEYTYRMTACNNSGVKRSSTGSASVGVFENPTRVDGTITETAWDVVNIDRNIKTVKVTRYGAGNDVSWTWD